MKTDNSEIEEEWEAAQASLRAAMRMPASAERVEALKKAGQQRFQADQKRQAFEERLKRSLK